MEKYYYTKDNLNGEVVSEAIRLRTSLRHEFIGCMISNKHDENDVILDDNVELQFSRALVSSEQDEITAIINIVGPSYDLVIRKNIEQNTMQWALKTGQEIMAQFGANNLYRGKSAEQVEALVTQYPDLIHSLVTGSLQTAYGVFLAMQPDANINQEELDEFRLRLAITLGL